MADHAQTDPNTAPSAEAPGGTRTINPERLKEMRDNVEAKYAGTQEALKKNEERTEAQEGGERKGLRAKQMEGIVKHHND